MKNAGAIIELRTSDNPEKMRETIMDELRRDFADWLTTNEDLVWRPRMELTEEGNEYAIRALLPGVHAGELEVLVVPDMLLIRGETRMRKKILRSIEFRRPVNPAKAHAEMRDGVLSIKAEIAGAKKVIRMPKAA